MRASRWSLGVACLALGCGSTGAADDDDAARADVGVAHDAGAGGVDAGTHETGPAPDGGRPDGRVADARGVADVAVFADVRGPADVLGTADARPPTDTATPPDAPADAAPADAATADATPVDLDALAPDARPPCIPSGAESCNGLDDDCNGDVDDGPDGPLAEPCFEGPEGLAGVGVCRLGRAVCLDGFFGACADAVLPSAEICDGLDNDCNGVADDDGVGGLLSFACYGGPPETEGLGPCRGGTVLCENAVLGPCVGEVLPSLEICGEADEDCDGTADDGLDCACVPGTEQDCYGGPPDTVGVGLCVVGQQTCLPDGSNFEACVGQITPVAETCDGLDEDCNGLVDDAVAGAGVECSVGQGVCASRGVMLCDAATFELRCDAVAGEPFPERCDAADNDCDGLADEDFDLGAPCVVGLGVCAAAGLTVCGADGAATCSVQAGQPGVERCNGLDDDCDGETDEGLGLGEACHVGLGECARDGRLGCAADGAVVCDAVPGAASAEACNGLDDDCDGEADEAVERACYGGEVGTQDVGPCRAGTQVCVEGQFGACEGEVAPAAESCDGTDEDCDGEVDEALARSCYGGPEGTRDVGECRGGFEACLDGLYTGVCAGEALPAPEVCNGLDDDCDGEVDEATSRACYSGAAGTQDVGPCRAGTQSCVDGAYGACEAEVVPRAETCNDTDDDCDGTVDDGVFQACYTGPEGSLGLGVCAPGVQTCVAGVFRACEQQVLPAPESCNGDDDDCDGETDEELTRACYDGPAGTRAVGACHDGTQRCAAGEYGLCEGDALPGVEACNNVDDDCDGVVDEGITQACYTGPPGTAGVGLCEAGLQTCAAGFFGACEVQTLPADESCNGDDDDCDGETDEDSDRPCYTGPAATRGVGVCHEGTEACVDGAFAACAGEVLPAAAERCDGTDDNCSGTVDEGFDLGQACTTGVGACSRDGVRVCDGNGGVMCNAIAGEPGMETCNGQDDDCDGETDEGLDCLQVTTGQYYTCAVLSGGRLKCWGLNSYGQLGLGDTAHRGDQANEMGVNLPVLNLGAGRAVRTVGAGVGHTCALLDDGTVKCWGSNDYGQLGLGDRAYRGDGPNEMGDALPAVDLGPGLRVVSLHVGGFHNCALLEGGSVKCWGRNTAGQLGYGDTSYRGDDAGEMGVNLPYVDLGTGRTAQALALGASDACALLDDNTMKCWGYNYNGQLGYGDTVSRGDQAGEMGDNLPTVPLGNGRSAREVRAGSSHTCAVLDDATVKCWGNNIHGQLGLGDSAQRGHGPGQMGDALPVVALGVGRTVRALGGGADSNCAALNNLVVKCWGYTAAGVLGYGDTVNRGDGAGEMGDALPAVNLGNGRSAARLASGLGIHTCAVLDDGRLKCWGANFWGQLGLGNTLNRGDNPGEMGDALPAVQLE